MKKPMKKKTKTKKEYPDDDGRVIASMDILDESRGKIKLDKKEKEAYNEAPLTKKETFNLIGSALAAALLIGLIFVAILGFFIFLLTKFWIN